MTDSAPGTITVTRTDLYNEVWTTPMRTLAAKYGLSDVGLAKTCERHGIPRPPVGYWAKKQFGKPVRKRPLPAVTAPELETIVFHPATVEDTPAETERPLPPFPDLTELATRDRDRATLVTVPESLHTPHPVVARTRAALVESIRERRSDRYGMVSPPYQIRGECFSVSIGKDSIPRAIRILQALTRALEKRGFTLQSGARDPHQSSGPAFVGHGATLHVSMSEKSTRSDHVLTTDEKKRAERHPSISWHQKYDYHPSGQLTLTIQDVTEHGRQMSWKETKRQPLEELFSDIVGEIPYLIAKSRTERAQAAERARLAAEEQIRRYHEQKRKREEAERVQSILQEAGEWRRAQLLRDYADVLRSEAIDRYGRIDRGSDMDNFLEWINGVADQIDPVHKRCPLPPSPVAPVDSSDVESVSPQPG